MGNVAQYEQISDRAVIAYIFQGLEGAAGNSWVPRLANEFSSDMAVETYAGLGNSPMMREWVGEKILNSLREYSMTISNKDWEATLRVFRKDLRRDKTGQLLARIGELAQRSVEHEAKLMTDLIVANGNAYDGVAFFAGTHSVGDSGTIDNDFTFAAATGTTPTAAEMATGLLDTVTEFYKFKDDTGEPTNQNAKNFLVMVPPVFYSPAAQAITKELVLSGGQSINNPLKGLGLTFNLMVNPRLTATDKFYVFIEDGPWKPFIKQVEDGPRVEVLTEGSDYAFFNAAHLYSVIKSGNVGYGRFDKAIRVTVT